MSKLSLSVKNLSVGYKNFKIDKVNFSLKEGDILGLLGRSGSGKSTIIKSLIGTQKPKRGSIKLKIDDETYSLKKHIGYSPQHNSIYPFLTLEENLKLFGTLQGVKRKVLKSRINILLKKVDLYNSRKKRITELSGGMAKRADLATSLINDPKIIILDEPFAGLDITITKFMWKMVQDLSKSGKIIIISSHLLADIKKYCNKYCLIESGDFYGTTKLMNLIKKTKKKSFEQFIESLFNKSKE